VNALLQSKGWSVIRLWEYDIKHDFDACIARILRAIDRADETLPAV
jgi:very-short-patch-repair endonuclease